MKYKDIITDEQLSRALNLCTKVLAFIDKNEEEDNVKSLAFEIMFNSLKKVKKENSVDAEIKRMIGTKRSDHNG